MLTHLNPAHQPIPQEMLLYLAPIEWSSMWQRPQQLASRLARGYRTCYVDPVGLRNMRVSDMRRVLRRMTPAVPTATDAPCRVFRPRYVPLLGVPGLDQLNKHWLLRQVTNAQASEAGKRVLWIGSPSLLAEAMVEADDADIVVYDCMDRYAAFHGGAASRRIERAEEAIVTRADLVFATSHRLQKRLRELNSKVVLAPNGVDYELFARETLAVPPTWARQIRRPVIGYYGTLGDWLNYPLLEDLARAHPHCSFVFIGPLGSQRASRLFSLSNVCYLGEVPYRDLPVHAAQFDVALVPFELNEVTRCVHPIKALEYLALGLPTVSARLPDLSDLSHVIQFADTLQEWSAAIEANLDQRLRSAEMVNARRSAVAGLSWDRLAEQIDGQMQTALNRATPRLDARKRPRLNLASRLGRKVA